MLSFGTRLKVFRQAAGINQTELAQKCEVTTRTVYSWENDKISMGMDKAEILVQMGANPIFLLCGSGDILLETIAL